MDVKTDENANAACVQRKLAFLQLDATSRRVLALMFIAIAVQGFYVYMPIFTLDVPEYRCRGNETEVRFFALRRTAFRQSVLIAVHLGLSLQSRSSPGIFWSFMGQVRFFKLKEKVKAFTKVVNYDENYHAVLYLCRLHKTFAVEIWKWLHQLRQKLYFLLPMSS